MIFWLTTKGSHEIFEVFKYAIHWERGLWETGRRSNDGQLTMTSIICGNMTKNPPNDDNQLWWEECLYDKK